MAPRAKSAPEPRNVYGWKDSPGWSQVMYDRLAFARKRGVQHGAPVRTALFHKLSNTMMPGYFEWHGWTEKTVETLCEHSLVGLPGCSGAAKTHNVAGFAVLWWLAAPEESSVTFISTSIKSLRRRGWAQVMRAYSMIPEIPRNKGNFVDSRMVWQWRKNDDKHAIIGKAVEEGSTQKVADDIKGVHTKRQMVVIDEATSVPAAIYEACANLYSYPEEFILVLIGNPLNRLDQFGRFCEPADGWNSVNVETGEWDGKAQLSMGGRQPRVITFDAEKCPNIIEGRVVSKHLPKKEEVEMARKNSGGGNSPLYWQNFRGFWPPEGLSKTVFSESVLKKNDAYGHHRFTGRHFTILGTFDPAFGGGDRAALRFARMGQIEGGAMGIEAWPPLIVPLDATSSNPVHFQLAEQVKRQCEGFTMGDMQYSCDPSNFALDATGEGGGLSDILKRTWSHDIIPVEFGGRASEDAASLEDERKAWDVYDNKSTEMHFRARDAVASGQLKGIDADTALELCNRQFEDMRADGSSLKRIKLQSKKAYRELFKKSPDFGDTLVMLLEVARRRGFRLKPAGQTAVGVEELEKVVEKTQAVWEPDAMYVAEELEEMV